MKSWNDVPAPPRAGPISFLWSAVRSVSGLASLVLNATGIWYLHSEMHKEKPTWVSYLSFIPILDWIPMLDIAGLPRPWILLPASIIVAASYFGMPGSPFIGVLLLLPILGLEVYRNYHILDHFEQRNWTTLIIWSLFRMEWLVVTSLAILGYERYQFVPHKQASITETMKQVQTRLDESLENSAIVGDYNIPFILTHWVWKHGLKTAVQVTSEYVHKAGIPEMVDKAGEWITSVIPSSTSSSPSTPSKQSSNKQNAE